MKYKLFKDAEGYLIVSDHRSVYGTDKHHRIKVCEYYGWSGIPGSIHVHHINENRSDNRIENLAILTEREHHRLHKLGKPRSEESKRKQAEYRKGKKLSEETKRKIGEIHKGKIVSEETKKKMSKSHKGKKLSEEHKRKMSESHRIRHWKNSYLNCQKHF